MVERVDALGTKYTHYRDGFRQRGVFTIHDQRVRIAGQWADVDTALREDGAEGFADHIGAARYQARFRPDGSFAWLPRHEVSTEAVLAGPLETYVGGAWKLLGATFQRAGHELRASVGSLVVVEEAYWKGVRTRLVLRDASAPTRFRRAVALHNLGLVDGWTLKSGNSDVGHVGGVGAWDANMDWLPVSERFVAGRLEFSVDTTGAVFPVTIDPTFSTPANNSVGCTMLGNSTVNYGGTIYVLAGTSGLLYKGLFRFDLSSIAAGTTCLQAYLTLKVQTQNAVSKTHDLYAVMPANANWSEGSKNGAAATAGEVCSTWRVYNTTAWAGSAKCNTAGTDYVAAVLGTIVHPTGVAGTPANSSDLTNSEIAKWFGDSNNPGLLLQPQGADAGRYWRSDEYGGSEPVFTVSYAEQFLFPRRSIHLLPHYRM